MGTKTRGELPEPPRSQTGLVEIVLLIAFVGTPLALTPGLLLGYDITPKLAILYIAAATLLLYPGRWWPGASRLWQTSHGRLFYVLLLAQSASLALSSALSRDPILALGGTSLTRMGALTQILILFVVGVVAAQVSILPAFTRNLLLAIEICGAIAGIYGILQYLGWDPILPARLYTTQFIGDIVRPPATLRHAMYFANFLLPVILIAAAFAIHEKRLVWRCFHLGAVAIAATALVLTGTRSALLGLMVGGVLFAFLEARRTGGKRMLVYAAVFALASTALVLLLVFSPVGKSFRVRLAQWTQDSAGGTRLMVWRESLPLIANHWLAGIGPDAFAGEFRKHQSLQLSRAFPDRYHEDPHNLMINTAVSQGVAGPALIAGLIILGLVCAFRRKQALLVAIIVALTISEQFDPMTITNALYFYLPTALAVALAKSAPCQTAAPGLAARAVQAVAALVILAAAALYVIPDALLAEAGRQLSHGDVAGARESFQRTLRFPFPEDRLWFSQQAARQSLTAAREASAAAEQSPEQRFSALYQSASLAVIAGDLANAEVKLRAAEVVEPWWYRVHAMLAQVLWLTGRGTEAEQEAALALECAGSQEAKVRAALDSARAQAYSAFFPSTPAEKASQPAPPQSPAGPLAGSKLRPK